MRRREFLVLAGAAAAWPIAVRAQQAGKKGTVGTLGVTPHVPETIEAFTRGIGQFYSEFAIEARHPRSRSELLSDLAAGLVRLKVDVIFARGPQAVIAAKNATSSIPIVAIDLESDPIAKGFVKTLARPGGNITGVFLDLPEMSGKQIELLKEMFPELKRVAILGDPAINALQFATTETVARSFGLQPETIEVQLQPESAELRDRNGFEVAVETAKTRHAEAGVLLSSPSVFSAMTNIAEFATNKKLPLISLFGEFPRAGGFMAYGPSLPDSFRKCGNYVGKILQGAKPGDLPIERPERFELVINLKTAKAFGIRVPPLLLTRADEVIE
jgi:putative tryptophan/tyrosine transport system substrate-binding protein